MSRRKRDFSSLIPFFFGQTGGKPKEVSTGKLGLQQGRWITAEGRNGFFGKGENNLRIESASVAMNASRKYESSSVTMRRFTITEVTAGSLQGGNLTATGGDTKASGEEGQEQTTGTKENTGMSLRDWQNRFQTKISSVSLRSSASQTYEEIRNQTIRYIYELFFGNRQSRGNWLDTALGRNSGTESSQGSTQADSTQTDNTRTENQTGTTGTLNKSQEEGNLIWLVNSPTARCKRLEYVQESYYQEKESTSFSTVGTVRTGDGREINFNINVGMSRSFEERYREQLDLASFTFCDPLVINLDTDAVELTDQTMFFDIDADGTPDEVAGPGSGSGYLALDKNGDGIINDGSELFGTKSGNGFADLAQYDEDGNGWIDENDAIWDKLKIWMKDENGNDVLYKLSEKGVGAICLQNVSTDYTQKSQTGQTLGAVRYSGAFLYENGDCGTIQHVDIAKYAKEA